MKPIAIGCDPNAAELKTHLMKHLTELGYEYEDYGSADPIYANTAVRVAEAVVAGKHERGILMCGTGIGVSIAANKVHGAYAALVTDAYSAERSVKSNNANIICFGALTIGVEVAKSLLSIWLSCKYAPGTPSAAKIERICEYERSHGP